MPRLIPVSTLALYAAQRDAPETVRGFDARAAQHGIRWHENLASSTERRPSRWFPWAMIIAVATLGVLFALIGP